MLKKANFLRTLQKSCIYKTFFYTTIIKIFQNMLKIGFFGTPELSASVLRGLLENENFSVEFAVTNPDKKFGRAQTLIASPVKQLAESYKIPVFQPEKIRNNTELCR